MALMVFYNHSNLDEIVFEHRNKEYGAYVLRKAHFRNLMTGFIISLSVFLLTVFTYFIIVNFEMPGEKVVEFNPLLLKNYAENIDMILPESPAVTTNPSENTANQNIVTPDEKPGKNSSGNITIDSSETFNDTLSTTNTGGGIEGDTNTTGGSGVYTYVENMPIFPGGQQGILDYLVTHTRYPVQAIQYNIYGTVEVIFYITQEGLVDNVKVAKSANPILDNEAIRVIKAMPKWKPGTRNGRPVTVMYKVPITFPQIVRK